MTDDLTEIVLFQGMTVRTVVEAINLRLQEKNLRLVETLNDVDGKITFVIAKPNHG